MRCLCAQELVLIITAGVGAVYAAYHLGKRCARARLRVCVM